MAEEIINALARVEGLRVAPRTSTFHCRERTSDLGEIARTLGVDTVLEGSVKTSGSRLRVTAQLVDIADGRAVWSHRFDGDMTDVFAIQDEISSRIVGGLRGRLIEQSVQPIRRHTGNLEAYHLYLRGRHHRFTTFRLVDAMHAFQQAVQHDPTYAPALAGLADAATTLCLYGLIPPNEAKRAVRDAIVRALANDATLAVAHACLGRYAFYFDRNWIDALCSFERALVLSHDESEIHGLLAICYGNRAEEAGARRHIERAIAIDPLSAWNRSVSALTAYNIGHLDEAVEYARAALELRPDSVMGQWILGTSLTSLGRGAEAVEALEAAATRIGPLDYLVALLSSAYVAAGDWDRADALFGSLERKATKGWVSSAWMGMAACGLGRKDLALDHLARGCDEGDPWLASIAFPSYDPLRGDPRFVEIVRRLNLPESIGQPRLI
jgi:serine/threonine-protein kinase